MTGAQLRRLFFIGLSLYNHRSEFTKRLGVELMDMAEGVLGQMSERPKASRWTLTDERIKRRE